MSPTLAPSSVSFSFCVFEDLLQLMMIREESVSAPLGVFLAGDECVWGKDEKCSLIGSG